jgi:hypothetical protein
MLSVKYKTLIFLTPDPDDATLGGSLVIRAWRVLRLRLEETASR